VKRSEAKAKAIHGAMSFGELRNLIRASRGRGGMSRVNPAFTLEQALDIYERAIADRVDGETPPGLRHDVYRPGRMRRTRDGLIVQNILRDCG